MVGGMLLNRTNNSRLKNMALLSPETVWNLNQKELLDLLESRTFAAPHKKVSFYAPGFSFYKSNFFAPSSNSFPTISITGRLCGLNCKHCGGKVLETMHSAVTPQELFELCLKLKQEGAQGCLISGGCLPDGSVPLTQIAPALKRIKNELSLSIFVHTGIINLEGPLC